MAQQTDARDPAVEKVVDQVRKLLNLAAKNPNENEAAAATAKAMSLLAAHNLDMATVGQGGEDGRREDARQRGGMYTYERDLWRSVAQLNFCWHFPTREFHRDKRGRRRVTFHHRLVGRVVNTTSTRVMAQHLQQTIERLCRARLADDHAGASGGQLNSQFFSSWAVAYREGMAHRVILKLRERRAADEEARELEAEKARDRAARKGTSTATTLTIADVKQSEDKANYDFLHGAGAWDRREARWEEDRREQARADAEAEAELAQWAKDNPEEAAREARKEAARERERERREARGGGGGRYRAPTAEERRQGSGAFWAGYDKGAEIGIDPQADSRGSTKQIGRA